MSTDFVLQNHVMRRFFLKKPLLGIFVENARSPHARSLLYASLYTTAALLQEKKPISRKNLP